MAYCHRGIIYLESDRTDKALTDFNSAIALDANNSSAYAERGLFYLKQNRPKLALSDLDNAIKLNPYQPEPYLNRAQVSRQLQDISKAKRNLTRAMQIYTQRNNVPDYQATRRILLKL